MLETANNHHSQGERTYREAVSQGSYNTYTANLLGKFDNARLYWEDQTTRIALLDPISSLLDDISTHVRVLDLGCGSGQGYDNLTRLERDHLSLEEAHDWLLPEDSLYYHGIDLSEAMVERGRKNYAHRSNIRFEKHDLNEGLANIKSEEEPFHIYYSSYGSLSHLQRHNLVNLLADIAEHGMNGSLVVLDLLGRYSLEWPRYWSAETEEEKYTHYTMSYLYLGDEEAMAKAEFFPIRFWAGAEIPLLIDEVNAKSGYEYAVPVQADRSILIGRHSDTQEFNSEIPSIRSKINLLLEDHRRTHLPSLLLDPSIVPDGAPVTAFLRKYIQCWNTLVEFTQKRVEKALRLTEVKGWSKFPAPLQFALMSMDRVINDINWMGFGDPRANILEPQLAYTLQALERNLQQGLGVGHGLVVVLRLVK
ncbi:MAG: class I SAM-dependent methyltransferase [Gemmataceae bacterium]